MYIDCPFYKISQKNATTALCRDLSNYPNGIVLLLDKPYRWTSADVVRRVKFKLQRFSNQKNIKVGHAGTLDPLATGVLILCIGKTTKIAEKLQSESKEYIAEIEFGATTPSYDLEKSPDMLYLYKHITQKHIEEILPTFIGEQQQVPPIFSAKLIDGIRAYELARAGISQEMNPSKITISKLRIIHFDNPILKIEISCSKGTYIRSFARDLGIALNSGAHLKNLRRTASGNYRIEDCLSLDQFEKIIST